MNGLTYIRKRCNISLGELAATIGVSRQAVSSWENERKAIPERRKKQLSEFFGIDEKYFGDISEEDKIELLKKAMYSWDGLNKEAFLYRPDSKHMPERYKNTVFFIEDRDKSLDEEYNEHRLMKDALVKKIETSISQSDKSGLCLKDRMASINRGLALYGRAYELAEGMEKQALGDKILYYCEVLSTLDAAKAGLSVNTDDAGYTELREELVDTKWIEHLSEEIRNHWEAIRKDAGASRTRPNESALTAAYCSKEPTISEAEAEYAKLFDAEPAFRRHGLTVGVKRT